MICFLYRFERVVGHGMSIERRDYSSSRIQWIDALRAFAVLLVIWGHIWSKGNSLYFQIFNPVKIPLFFAITGYLFNTKKTWEQFFKSTLFHFVIPWFFLSMIWLKISYGLLIEQPDKAWISFCDFLSGKTHWYMPCCIIAVTIHFSIVRCFPNHRNIQYLIFVIIAILGFLFGRYNLAHFAMFDVACSAQMFLLVGRLLKDNMTRLDRKQYACIGSVIYLGLILLSFFLFPGRSMDVHQQRYYSFPICIALVLIGNTTLFVIAAKKKTYPRWICYIGENTLVFYLLHYYIRSAWKFLLAKMEITISAGIIAYFAEFLIVIIVLFVVAWLINHFFPFALGKGIMKMRLMKE